MKKLVLAVLAFAIVGCAKFPTNGVARSTRIVFSMTLAGPVNPNLFYRVVMNFTPQPLPPTTNGPVPVVNSPFGNGFVAGTATNFVDWQPAAYINQYGLFQFRTTDLLSQVQIGVPVLSDPVTIAPGGNGRVIRFTLDLSQLGLSDTDTAALQTMQVNFLTYSVPANGSQRSWDSIGDPNNADRSIPIPLNVSKVYTNATISDPQLQESSGDTNDPALDIVDWSIEVQRP